MNVRWPLTLKRKAELKVFTSLNNEQRTKRPAINFQPSNVHSDKRSIAPLFLHGVTQ